MSFNFLRTGKCLASTVVIPGPNDLQYKFQFPPTGKARVGLLWRYTWVAWRTVSIPSDRESTGRLYLFIILYAFGKKFQFPPNGKARVDLPYFRPKRAATPDPLKPNANCARHFLSKIYPNNPGNPDNPWPQRDFLAKMPRKSGSVCILGPFQRCLHPVYTSRLFLSVYVQFWKLSIFFLRTRLFWNRRSTLNAFTFVCRKSHLHSITLADIQVCPLIERENKKVVSKATQRKPPPEVWGVPFLLHGVGASRWAVVRDRGKSFHSLRTGKHV